MPGWYDDDGGFLTRLILGEDSLDFDPETGRWSCTCVKFTDYGRCRHVFSFRRKETLDVREEYL